MKSLLCWAAGFALALAPVGVAAQEVEATPDIFAGMMDAFAAEPLTPEQEARLPMAQDLVNRMLPSGTLGSVMFPMLGSFVAPLTEDGEPEAIRFVERQLGLSPWELDLTDAQAEAAAAMFDPAWREREQRTADAMPAVMAAMTGAMEGPIRRVLAELYAIHFTSAELADISAFFATPSGAAYARQSFSMTSDPRLAMMVLQQMPAMMEATAAMEAELQESMADLPVPRTLADLTPTERKGLAQLVGMSVEELELQVNSYNSSGEWIGDEAAEGY